jgi:hypothetical protein
MSERRHILLLAGVAAACVLAPLLILTGTGGPVRVAATLVVLALAPGTAIAGARRRRTPELGLAVGLSLACSAVIAQAMLTLNLWAPRAATCVLALVCLPPVAIRTYKTLDYEPAPASEGEP